MKKIILAAALMLSVATFAQKEEIKVLKRMDRSSSSPDKKDFDKISEALSSLDSKLELLSDEEKALYYYFKTSTPILEFMFIADNSKNPTAIQEALVRFNSDEFLKKIGFHYKLLIDIENKIGKNEHTEDIKPIIDMIKQELYKSAIQFNNEKKFKESSGIFYGLYQLDNSTGSNLENAAILAVQAEDFITAEELYKELKSSDYLNNGVLYFAVNKASNQEETFQNREDMVKMIALGSHERPRTFKVSEKKPEVYKTLSIISSQNGNSQGAKDVIDEALSIFPNNKDIKIEGGRIYFNEAYYILKDDQELVDNINKNLDKKTKYDELSNIRVSLFNKALPILEKAYSLNSDDENTRLLLKNCYEVLGMKDKAATIK
jgi:hypothetical protein